MSILREYGAFCHQLSKDVPGFPALPYLSNGVPIQKLDSLYYYRSYPKIFLDALHYYYSYPKMSLDSLHYFQSYPNMSLDFL